MRRTIQTALISLEWLIKAGVPMDLDAMWQENSDENCDTGTSLKKLTREFPQLDFSKIDPIYPDKSEGTKYEYSLQANKARGEACLKDLYGREEKVIAVVSHSAFMRTGVTRRRYANADYRIFTFGKGPEGFLELWEDEETERKGGGLGRSEVGIFEIRDWDFPPEDEEEREEEEEEEEEEEGEGDDDDKDEECVDAHS